MYSTSRFPQTALRAERGQSTLARALTTLRIMERAIDADSTHARPTAEAMGIDPPVLEPLIYKSCTHNSLHIQ